MKKAKIVKIVFEEGEYGLTQGHKAFEKPHYDKCGNATTKKVCNTLEVSSPVCATINSLIKSIITSMSRVHIEEDVRNAIDSYMNGKATASDDNDDFALPFN